MEYTAAKIDAIIKERQMKGEKVYNLATGDPNYPVPPRIMGGIEYAIKSNIHNYSPVVGYESLRRKIWPTNPNNVIIGNGAKELINLAIQTLMMDSPATHFLICGPTWSCYEDMIKAAGGTCEILDLFQSNNILQKISEKINPNLRAIVLNNPNNPTGRIYDAGIMKRLLDMAIKNDFYLIVDEVYEDFIYDEKFPYQSMAGFDNTIVIKSFSKKYSLTGWRFGYLITPHKSLIVKMTMQKGNLIGPPNSLIQKAVEYNWDCVLDNRLDEFRARRDYLAEACNWKAPDGGFYFCVPVYNFTKTANELIDHNIYILPGSLYGMPDYARISFAGVSLDDLKEIQPFLATII